MNKYCIQCMFLKDCFKQVSGQYSFPIAFHIISFIKIYYVSENSLYVKLF